MNDGLGVMAQDLFTDTSIGERLEEVITRIATANFANNRDLCYNKDVVKTHKGDDDMSSALSEFLGKPLRDVVAAFHPDMVQKACAGGIVGCPAEYASFGDSYNICVDCSGDRDDCDRCWGQIYEGNRDGEV